MSDWLFPFQSRWYCRYYCALFHQQLYNYAHSLQVVCTQDGQWKCFKSKLLLANIKINKLSHCLFILYIFPLTIERQGYGVMNVLNMQPLYYTRVLPSPPIPALHTCDTAELINGLQLQHNATVLSDDQVRRT